MNDDADNKPKTELVRGDLARHVMETVAPQAAAQVEENRLREIKQERDARWDGPPTYWLVEVSPGCWETTTPLPHGMPPLRVYGDPMGANGIRWQYACALTRMRIIRKWEDARAMAREAVFRCAGKAP